MSVDEDEALRLCALVVGEELFAIDIMRIREIVRPLEVTPVPLAPDWMEGLIDLRSEVLPLFDLRVRFDLPRRTAVELPRGRFLITRIGAIQIGLAVDEVVDVIDVQRRDMRVEANMLSGSAREFFVGVCPIKGRLGMLLNLHRLLSSEDRIAIHAIAQPGAAQGESP